MNAPDPPPPRPEAPPPTVPDVDLVRRIGRGGFGEVWLGVNRATGGLKAVKIIPLARGGQTTDPAGREIVSLTQFERQRIGHHPHLLDIHHVGRTDEVLFYLMDPADDVSGRPAANDPGYRPATLALTLEQGPLPADECLRCARQLAAGLAHLHEAGMVHRDVKPSNCLFVGRALRLADFGLLVPAAAHLSRLGTVRYMPPDGRMDLRADVYAAGLVIYEMLTGLPAEAFPRLGPRAREIAADPLLAHLNRVALGAASRDHHARHAHAGELLAAIEDIPAPRPHRRPAVWAAVAVAAGLAAVAVWPRDGGPRPEAGDAADPAPGRVAVNFITEPYESLVLLDGVLLIGPDGHPLTTPCTAADVAGRPGRVTFRHPRRDDLDAGTIDFATTREVVARWPP
jgi:hypothetical protein